MTTRIRRKAAAPNLPEYPLPFMLQTERMNRATSQTHPLEVGWVDVPEAIGRLGITIAPGKRGPALTANIYHDRDLTLDLERLVTAHRADILFDCTEPSERSRLLDIPNLPQAAAGAGLTYYNLPIPDVTAPRTAKAVATAINAVTNLAADITAGSTIVINCRGGRGRSGMIAACVLVALGAWPDEAIARVRKARPRAVETCEQEEFVQQSTLRLMGLGWGNPAWANTQQ